MATKLTRRVGGFAWLLAVLMMLGCGGGGADPGADGEGGEGGGGAENKPAAETSATERPVVAFVTNQIADFWNIAKAGCMEAQKDFDVDVEVRMPDPATAVEQQRIVEDLVNSNIKAIAISPLDAENQKALINEVAGKIPLITQDSDAPGTDRLMYIGMDNYEAGRMTGKLMKKALPDGGKVMIFIGRLEQDNSKKRRQGFIDELLGRGEDPTRFEPVDAEPIKGEKYEIVATLTDGGKQDECQRKVEDALNAYPDVVGMVGLFEYNPVAIFQAVKQANKLGKVKIVGFDENKVTLQGIRDGHVIGTVVQNPFQYGYESVKLMVALLKEGEAALPEKREMNIPARIIDKTNVDEFEEDLKAKKEAASE